MLIESTVHLPVSLAMFQDLFHPPNADAFLRILLRWAHFVGRHHLDWFALLFQPRKCSGSKSARSGHEEESKSGFAGTRAVVFPLGRGGDSARRAWPILRCTSLRPTSQTRTHLAAATSIFGGCLFAWLTYPIVLFIVEFAIIKKVPALTKDGRVFAVVMIILVAFVSWGLIRFFDGMLTVGGQSYASNKTYSIGIGGAYGLVMMLNVWGIIWPNNKRILAATAGTGPAAPPELARQAFIASRTNAWLSLPLLLFMGTSHGDWVIFGK